MVEHSFGDAFVPLLDVADDKRILNSARRPENPNDGWFALLPRADAPWQELVIMVGRPELCED